MTVWARKTAMTVTAAAIPRVATARGTVRASATHALVRARRIAKIAKAGTLDATTALTARQIVKTVTPTVHTSAKGAMVLA